MRDLFFSSDPPFRTCVGSKVAADGVPKAVYPPAEVERGKRFDAKSKAEETEYDRSCRPGRSPEGEASGSSSSNETFLEDGVPEFDEEIDVRLVGVEDAREASSRESRGGRYDISG